MKGETDGQIDEWLDDNGLLEQMVDRTMNVRLFDLVWFGWLASIPFDFVHMH